jgi:hypothetical protein
MKRTMMLLTVLNMVMMTAGIGTVIAIGGISPMVIVAPEPTSIILVLTGLIGIFWFSMRKKK